MTNKTVRKDEDDNAEVEAWWPPFEFNGKRALESKLNLNLKNCQYELFRKIAVNELGWRVLDRHGNIQEPVREIRQAFAVLKDGNERSEDTLDNSKITWDIFWADGGISAESVAAMGPC